MKRIFCVLITAILLMLSACSYGGFKPAVYRMNDSYPRISLKADGEFVFVHDFAASRMTIGKYKAHKDKDDNVYVVLKAEDGETVYYFDVTEDSIVFDGEKSTPIEKSEEFGTEIVDGTEFPLWREYNRK